MWYTTEDARRDAARQAEQRGVRPTPECSSLCAIGERCVITEDGRCDALRVECARLRSALEAVALVPPDTVMTAYLMRETAKKAIAP